MQTLSAAVLSLALGAEPLKDEIHQDFSRGRLTEQLFKRVGPSPNKYMRREATGLRISLPGQSPPKWPVGIASRLVVHGDFEITASYRALRAEKPTAGYGVGVSLWLMMATPVNDAATLARFLRPKEGDVYSTDHAADVAEGQRKHKEKYFPTDVKKGKLRLSRTGSTLIYLVAEGDSNDFHELRREEAFGNQPLKTVRVAADTGGATSAVEIVLQDLRIRAEELSAGLTATRRASRSLWLLWGGALVVGGLLAVGGILYWRRAARTKNGKGDRQPGTIAKLKRVPDSK